MPRRRAKTKPDPTRPGSIVWTRRGKTQRVLAVVRAGAVAGGFVTVQTFNDLRRRWNPRHLIGAAQVLAFAKPEDYQVRRAISFADTELAAFLTQPEART